MKAKNIKYFDFQQVCDMLLRMRREIGGAEPQITPQIDNLLLIDRNIDPLTPLLSQLTYEGLIDEIFGINNSLFSISYENFVCTLVFFWNVI